MMVGFRKATDILGVFHLSEALYSSAQLPVRTLIYICTSCRLILTSTFIHHADYATTYEKTNQHSKSTRPEM